ncbi:hypothetical protein [Butyrivibrio sp. INlla21]|uniref:hypothetical protein n=1 Tax=Butyrivibrio sp. INlla21 TaxID=1520811 RepID=UPI0008E9D183|nr:hypothetical protein [Butyrivibrio sp. INlla21]SFU35450.1 hypothetical protein SAMN02910342_00209 [Butyrivibrio sp. INlla21]
MDKTLDMLCDRLLDEIESTVKKDLSPASLEMLDMAVDIIKDIKEVEAMESVGYSGRDRSYANYDNGNSMRGRYERSYSRTGSPMTELENLYNNAQSDKEREIIRKVMNQL